ncbi:SurA N-terminal domain-containing protein [Chelatococcus asaccharovorans]|uniref:Parvulin-like PPIase n=1 Tax=Chelatococcus asaccharovorans TaxID=28210 RepID=A0A2V3UC77_9HYPH|nr:SurA N-terminal domain-containing protein [Chelatococcus asaccharovorans]MBS7703479.1 SurA N-terminal domain-containing protein [Chelatococcus asaccharovorans]PXW61821.1 peptidyl-prolyl cis-trans isomerase D [Chelatococcus asaccharovorans]
MLNSFRNAGQSLIGRAIIAIMFGFLILSFGLWGVGDIFRGYAANTAANVGKTEITVQALRNAYQNELQRLQQQLRQPISAEMARRIGLEQQVLNRLINEAALDARARELGLAISDADLARAVMDDPVFRNAAGQFDRRRFDELLRYNGLTEASYLRDQRAVIIRRQLLEGVMGALETPIALQEAVYRYGAERRAASYVVLPAASVGTIADPDETALQSWFDARKAIFRAPEYRSVVTLTLTPETLAKPDAVSDADVRRVYEADKATRFGTPERRTVERITFPNLADAQAAAAKIAAGTTFEALAAERGLAEKDIAFGTFAKSELIDAAVADAVFSLAQGVASGAVEGRFGPVIVRVTAIEPASVKPLEAVSAEIRQGLARSAAQNQINDVHDRIEDDRLAAKPLAEIATALGLSAQTIAAVDQAGNDKNGQPVPGVAGNTALLNAIFASDVGADNEAIRLSDGGYEWFDVRGVDPAHERPLADVRDQVLVRWREDAIAKALSDKARALVERLNKGEALDAVAAELSLPVETATGLARGAASGNLAVPVVAQIFAVPAGKAGSVAAGTNGDARVVFVVTEATVPPYITSTGDAARIRDQMRTAVEEDLISEYSTKLRSELGVTINQRAINNAFGNTDL